jgi:hypothetical protein
MENEERKEFNERLATGGWSGNEERYKQRCEELERELAERVYNSPYYAGKEVWVCRCIGAGNLITAEPIKFEHTVRITKTKVSMVFRKFESNAIYQIQYHMDNAYWNPIEFRSREGVEFIYTEEPTHYEGEEYNRGYRTIGLTREEAVSNFKAQIQRQFTVPCETILVEA